MSLFRCYTEKKPGFDVEAKAVLDDLRGYLGLTALDSVRILNRYDVDGITNVIYSAARDTVLCEPQTDACYDECIPDLRPDDFMLIVEALPGQFDQRADSCSQCISLLMLGAHEHVSLYAPPAVKTAKVYVFSGDISDSTAAKLRSYLINRVESREGTFEKPDTLDMIYQQPEVAGALDGFICADASGLNGYRDSLALSMDSADLEFLQDYFRNTEKRDPTLTEIRVIDTYWSDHCRHTTFHTHLTDVRIDNPDVQKAYERYLKTRDEVYRKGDSGNLRPQTLMDIATIAAKALSSRGLLTNLDDSEEVNACSIHVDVVTDKGAEDWLLMFKNETHNHPTEVEPFGGAATCIGGAIRDPLSGRAFVFQGMRITGAGDPRAPVSETKPGKLPQKKLTVTAARGFSSYGNQIGLATGLVHEFYHDGYTAKRMELGAVVGAVKASNVKRGKPAAGDKVILLGGRTGRDGIGGATGSSKSHTTGAMEKMASEVQKGNAPEERKLQRLFLDPEVTGLIVRCNDFGAGGVAVAVGELADGLVINLSAVRRKYEGLNATELAISESQERMAVVVAPDDADFFISKASAENLEAYIIAEITDTSRMVMLFEGRTVVDISRRFLSSNGAPKFTTVYVPESHLSRSVATEVIPCSSIANSSACSRCAEPLPFVRRLLDLAADIRYCSQRGLYEMFDGTVGASGVTMKNGGKTQSTPVQAMAALLPVRDAETSTCSVMSFGFDPQLSSENPFSGAKFAVISSVAKLVASGCDPALAYLSFQEYFGNPQTDPVRWGRPFAALLGAFEAQMDLGLAAIGGKDSMSGSYEGLDVPPTLVSFAIAPCRAEHIITPEFKAAGHDVYLVKAGTDLSATKSLWSAVNRLIISKVVLSAWAVTDGGISEGIMKMAFGNEIGFEFDAGFLPDAFSSYAGGAIIAETTSSITDAASLITDAASLITDAAIPTPGAVLIGHTILEPVIRAGEESVTIAELKSTWESTLEPIFPTQTSSPVNPVIAATEPQSHEICLEIFHETSVCKPVAADGIIYAGNKDFAKPRALILTFPGTNSELDTARAVQRAGGVPRVLVIRNLTPDMLSESITETVNAINESQILIIPGGFSFGDEPDGSAKFLAVYFRYPAVADAINTHLKARDGLMLGICNGFQALIKLGLVPFGQIVKPDRNNPTLTHNTIGRHQAGYVYTRVASVKSPWMSLCCPGDVHAIPVSHGEGRFIANAETLSELASDGRIATQYCDPDGLPTMDIQYNPNGSMMAVEGLFSPDGRVFGKMGHSERRSEYTAVNIYGNKHQPVFESGIYYY